MKASKVQSTKYNETYMFQYQVRIGKYPHVKFYSTSPFAFLSRDAAKREARKMLRKRGYNPRKAAIYTRKKIDLYSKDTHTTKEAS